MAMPERSDGIARAIGDAVTDIREKLVEIGWFGRALAPQDRPISHALGRDIGSERDPAEREREDEREWRDVSQARPGERPISEALGWTQSGADAASPQPAAHYHGYGHDHGIDR